MNAACSSSCLAAGLLTCAAHAHHSTFGRFDSEDIVEIEGEVLDVFWRNPHAYFVVATTEKNGDRVVWELETSGATQLLRRGIKPDFIRVGQHIRAAGLAPLTAKKELYARNILLPSREELLLGNFEPRWASEGIGDASFENRSAGDSSRADLGIFRVWSYSDASPFLFPEDVDADFDMNRYPLTPAARAVLQRFNRATDNPTRDCVPKGMPTIMEQPYPMEIVRDEENILLRIEEYDTVRTIRMDEATVSQDEQPSALGYSVGRWEGTTLVVTTTHLNWPWFDQLGIPQSEDSVLVERFSPTEDGSRLDYVLTVTDPVSFTEPVSLERYWLYLPDQEVLPYECSERV
jgi:hypothetical protein